MLLLGCVSLLDSRSLAEQIVGGSDDNSFKSTNHRVIPNVFFFLADLKLSDVLIFEPTLELFSCILEAFILLRCCGNNPSPCSYLNIKFIRG